MTTWLFNVSVLHLSASSEPRLASFAAEGQLACRMFFNGKPLDLTFQPASEMIGGGKPRSTFLYRIQSLTVADLLNMLRQRSVRFYIVPVKRNSDPLGKEIRAACRATTNIMCIAERGGGLLELPLTSAASKEEGNSGIVGTLSVCIAFDQLAEVELRLKEFYVSGLENGIYGLHCRLAPFKEGVVSKLTRALSGTARWTDAEVPMAKYRGVLRNLKKHQFAIAVYLIDGNNNKRPVASFEVDLAIKNTRASCKEITIPFSMSDGKTSTTVNGALQLSGLPTFEDEMQKILRAGPACVDTEDEKKEKNKFSDPEGAKSSEAESTTEIDTENSSMGRHLPEYSQGSSPPIVSRTSTPTRASPRDISSPPSEDQDAEDCRFSFPSKNSISALWHSEADLESPTPPPEKDMDVHGDVPPPTPPPEKDMDVHGDVPPPTPPPEKDMDVHGDVPPPTPPPEKDMDVHGDVPPPTPPPEKDMDVHGDVPPPTPPPEKDMDVHGDVPPPTPPPEKDMDVHGDVPPPTPPPEKDMDVHGDVPMVVEGSANVDSSCVLVCSGGAEDVVDVPADLESVDDENVYVSELQSTAVLNEDVTLLLDECDRMVVGRDEGASGRSVGVPTLQASNLIEFPPPSNGKEPATSREEAADLLLTRERELLDAMEHENECIDMLVQSLRRMDNASEKDRAAYCAEVDRLQQQFKLLDEAEEELTLLLARATQRFNLCREERRKSQLELLEARARKETYSLALAMMDQELRTQFDNDGNRRPGGMFLSKSDSS
ncbi:hypothetical protein DPX39_110029300 [Trypanosoma brucei equiperdum]|uniref:Uncharacterized protein n=1 Tax=Trypanosoma brucei equiperdum TaxID=630700 RepID=A0A3L6KTH4_9TRYP|nr:hypothetical protein DPX39_110029300 [Trypanosoma brucei equiperdum]